jgi:deoxyadenosine/deoxycytidine kinase
MPNNNSLTKADLDALEQRLQERFQQLEAHIDERTHDAETRLLRAFGDYQQAQATRYRHMKADLGNLDTATDQRLDALETRVTNMDKRLIEKGI